MAIPIDPSHKVSFVRYEGKKTIVTINDIDYEFKLQAKNGDKWKDITGEKTWEEQAKIISNTVVRIIGQDTFESAELEFTGAFPDADSGTDAKEIKFASGEVKFKDTNGKNQKRKYQANSGESIAIMHALKMVALTTLINGYKDKDDIEKTRLTKYIRENFFRNNQETCEIMKNFIYWDDTAKWESSDKSLPKPGTTQIGTYPADKYGDYRVETMSDDDLQNLFLNRKDDVIAHAKAGNR